MLSLMQTSCCAGASLSVMRGLSSAFADMVAFFGNPQDFEAFMLMVLPGKLCTSTY